jgi:NAD(P)H dehydrogenase (quinone)
MLRYIIIIIELLYTKDIMKTVIFVYLLLALNCAYCAPKSKILIVFAHQEPQSFCFALRNRVFQTLIMKGHEVKISNLVQMKMIGSLDRTDFTEAADPSYFRPQVEQTAANLKNRTTFVKELRAEIDKVDWADIMLFIFPYYVMYMPSITKSWMERVFTCGSAYCDGHSLKGKKVMFMYSTGSDANYLKDIEPVFWNSTARLFEFMQAQYLVPFRAYGVQKITEDARKKYLADVERVVGDIEHRAPYIHDP